MQRRVETPFRSLESFFEGQEILDFLSPENGTLSVASKFPYGVAIPRCEMSQKSIDVTKY